jgi:hypothetical protein
MNNAGIAGIAEVTGGRRPFGRRMDREEGAIHKRLRSLRAFVIASSSRSIPREARATRRLSALRARRSLR